VTEIQPLIPSVLLLITTMHFPQSFLSAIKRGMAKIGRPRAKVVLSDEERRPSAPNTMTSALVAVGYAAP
jgi:hypothetical protein